MTPSERPVEPSSVVVVDRYYKSWMDWDSEDNLPIISDVTERLISIGRMWKDFFATFSIPKSPVPYGCFYPQPVCEEKVEDPLSVFMMSEAQTFRRLTPENEPVGRWPRPALVVVYNGYDDENFGADYASNLLRAYGAKGYPNHLIPPILLPFATLEEDLGIVKVLEDRPFCEPFRKTVESALRYRFRSFDLSLPKA